MDIHPKWHDAKESAILADRLQSKVAKEITTDVANEIAESRNMRMQDARILFLTEWIKNSKLFIDSVYNDLKDEISDHAYNYPMRYFPCDTYCSFSGRNSHARIQQILRSLPVLKKILEPGKITDPVPQVILPGVDFTAESIVYGGFLGKPQIEIDRDLLEWSKKSSRADYCLGAVAFGSEDFETLTLAWVHGEVGSITEYSDSLDTLLEEALHGCADQIAKTPRYGEEDVDKEHYWMNEYGTFPEHIFEAIVKHGRAFRGSLSGLLEE